MPQDKSESRGLSPPQPANTARRRQEKLERKEKKTGFLQEILLCLLNWQVCCGKHPRGLAKEVTNFREPCSERQRGTLEKWHLFRWCVQNDVFFLPPAAGWLAGHRNRNFPLSQNFLTGLETYGGRRLAYYERVLPGPHSE